MTRIDETEGIDRRQQIMEAALTTFSTKGFHKATNKDIALAAGGISPGLIYHYFKDKQDLLVSIIQERATILQMADHPEQLMELPPREGLTLIGNTYLAMLQVPSNRALLAVVIGEFSRFPWIGETVYRMAISKFFGVLMRYLQHQIDLGRIRPHDTSIAARSLMGMFVAHVLARDIFRQPEALETADAQVVTTAVDIFVCGLEVSQAHGCPQANK